MKVLYAVLIALALVSDYAYAAPKTFDDWLGWILAVTIYLLILGLVLLVFGLLAKLWKDIWGGSGTTPFIFFFNLFARASPLPAVPMLLICGNEGFCEADENQLQRARISYRKLENATLLEVEKEIQRRRLSGTLYQWIHIAAHGSRAGFKLGDNEMMTTDWCADNLEGVKVVFCASCDSVETGDALSGIVDAVVVVYGRRGSGLISAFAFAFWREMAESGNPRKAFQAALNDVPQLRPYVDLQVRRA